MYKYVSVLGVFAKKTRKYIRIEQIEGCWNE